MKNCLKNKIELLSPAGNMDSLKAAVNNGCDAVYLGGRNFSARNMADNFTDSELEAAIDYAHIRGVKTYITVNTLYKAHELPVVLKFCAAAYRAGADAFIVQDLGAASALRETFDIPIHASTQLTVRALEDAEFIKSLGFKRVILSRETPLDEIKKISDAVETEVFIHGALCYSHSGRCLMSAFLSGRPSGESSASGERSGNRGNCAQPCRLKYELRAEGETVREGYLLSPRDMMTLNILPEIIEAGVSALKIEGRLKSPQYVAMATRAYRERIDRILAESRTADYPHRNPCERLAVDETQNYTELAQVFSRGGDFSEGYFKTHSSPEMMSVETPKSTGALIGEVVNYIPKLGKCVISLNGELVGGDGVEISAKKRVGAYYNSAIPASAGDKVTINIRIDNREDNPRPGDKVYKSYDKRLDDRLKKLASADNRRLTLYASVTAKADQRLRFTLNHNNTVAEVYGETIARAVNQPLTKERLLDQLAKAGGTPFRIEFTDCDIEDNIYANIKSINATRRQALEEMEQRIAESYKRMTAPVNDGYIPWVRGTHSKAEPHSRLTVLASNPEQAMAVLDFRPGRIYLEYSAFDALDEITARAHEKGVAVYAALPSCPWPAEDELFNKLAKSDADGYLARTFSHLHKLNALGNLKELALDYGFNVTNPLAFRELRKFAASVCLSPELDISEIADEHTEAIVYGRLTLMTTNQCPVGLYAGAKTGGMYCGMRGDSTTYSLIDRKAEAFPVIKDCEACVARILSCRPINRRAACGYIRVEFTTESREECIKVLSEYRSF